MHDGPSCPTQRLDNEAPISPIQELLGPSAPMIMRQVYAAYERKAVRAGFDKDNPPTSEQVAKLEAEQQRRRTRGGPGVDRQSRWEWGRQALPASPLSVHPR